MIDRIKNFLEDFLETLPEVWRRVQNHLNWRLVRGLGQLKILTRASYLLLVVVPLLAALWPAVRVVVNDYNRVVKDAAGIMSATRPEFARAASDLQAALAQSQAVPPTGAVPAPDLSAVALERLRSITSTFDARVQEYMHDYSGPPLESPSLPWSLAALFFAALFIALGHMMYQVWAPEAVQASSIEEYVTSKKDDYAKHPSSEALTNARLALRGKTGRRVMASFDHEGEEFLRQMHRHWRNGAFREPLEVEQAIKSLPASTLQSIRQWLQSGKSPAPEDYQDAMRELVERLTGHASPLDQAASMGVIERGARSHYLHLAGSRAIPMMLTAILYIFGMIVTCIVVEHQASSVADAAQWPSWWSCVAPPNKTQQPTGAPSGAGG